MKTFKGFAAAAALSLATFGAVSSASAATFVDIAVSGEPGDSIAWNGATKTLSITNLLTQLNFSDLIFDDNFGQAAILNLTATTTDALTLNPSGTFTQTGLSGTFEFRSTDLSTVLFAGTFSSYWLQGVPNQPLFTSGALTAMAGTANFYSDIVGLTGLEQDNFGLSFSGVQSGATPGFRVVGGALQSFTGSSVVGTFSGAIPEPGTWALMILGFGGAGAMIRSRRRVAFAA